VWKVRFGKRSGSWAEAGRRLWGERTESGVAAEDGEHGFEADDEVILAESRAAMTPDTHFTTGEPTPEPFIDTDPTQRLLTVLGRFQRQVNLADSGAPADQWVDACIDQVVGGIEIAFESGWDGVKEALTDTARVLQSYDDGGDPQGAVPFLLDAYEILCLMVGDLIVDNVRSGVMRKWRERYAQAVEQLHASGHRLVDDENPEQEARATTTGTPSNITPFQPRALSPIEEHDVELRDLASEADDEDDEDTPFEPPSFQEPVDALSQDDGEAESAWNEEENPYLEQELEAALEEEAVEADAPEAPFGDVPDADEAVTEEEVRYEAMSVEEYLASRAEEAEEEEPAEVEYLVEVEAVLEEDMPDETPEPILAVMEPPAPAPAPVPAPQQDLFDLAMSEIEAAAHQEPAPAAAPVAAPLGELFEGLPEEAAEVYAVEAAEAAPEPVAVEAARPEPDPETTPEPTPERLWTSARDAMSRGDVSDAKVLALRLAADMAILEARRAEDSVEEAADLLEQVSAAIAEAEQRVADSETHLEDTQQQRSQREQDLDAKREQVIAAEERVTEVEIGIADIEQQIAELQAKLAEEAARLKESQAVLDAEQNDEQAISEEIAQLRELEDASRGALDDARAQAADLREERGVREQSKAAREAHLAKLRSSLEGIESTLRVVAGEPEA
jgi:hypothetical protein